MSDSARQPVYVFESFRLDAQRRVLFGADGQPITLTPRLFDTLLYFVERAGQLLTKEQLLEDLWPNVVVEEHNLNKTVSELRRALGEQPGEHKFFVTKPGRGYRFVADVTIESHGADGGTLSKDNSQVSSQHGRASVSRPRLVTVGLLAATLVVIVARTYFGGDRLATEESVAVLPFVDLSPSGDQAWLADGFADEIRNSLAQLPELRVTARSSSFQFRDQTRDIREIAERLGVANALEGSVQSVGDDIHITAQLIRAADGFQLWSNSYDGATADLFAFQRDVAERVAVALDVVLDDTSRTRMFASGTTNPEAFREYQEGWRIYNLVHLAQVEQTLWDANEHFERAMALDPKFAMAAVGRADAFIHFLVRPPRPLVRNSPYSRDEALELLRENFDFISENGASATVRLAAQIQRESFSPSWDRMSFLLAQFRQQWHAHELTLGNGVDGALWLPHILSITGNHDLVRELAETHVTNDPLSTDAWIRRVAVEIRSRDFDAARTVLAQARQRLGPASLMNEDFRIALLSGDREKAIEVLRTNPTQESAMVVAAMSGEYDKAMAIAEQLEKQLTDPPGGPFWGGLIYTYYETGAAERASALVKRIDDSLVGPQIFILFLAENGGQPYFDFKDAPNFGAKLKRANVDPASFHWMTRLSTLPMPLNESGDR